VKQLKCQLRYRCKNSTTQIGLMLPELFNTTV